MLVSLELKVFFVRVERDYMDDRTRLWADPYCYSHQHQSGTFLLSDTDRYPSVIRVIVVTAPIY